MWLFISVIAQIILGTSAVFDKALLRRGFFDPWVYTFWSAVLGMLVVVLLPFGHASLGFYVVAMALLQGAIFIFGTLFFFLAIKQGEVSVSFPVIGSLAPVFTLIFSYLFLQDKIGSGSLLAFIFLVFGGLLVLGAESKEARRSIFLLGGVSAVLFGLSNVLAKLVFDSAPFISAFVWMRVGNFIVVLIFLVFKSFRGNLKKSLVQNQNKNNFLYLSNRVYAAMGGLLVPLAISMAHPALVDAMSTLRFVVIFFAAWILLGEKFRGRELFLKTLAAFLVVFGLVLLALVSYANSIPVDYDRPITWGVTFSSKFSKELGLDWKENFKAVIFDLRPKKIRLIAYWDDIEKEEDEFDFSDLDWQMDMAHRAGIKVVLAVGMKVPRWPECHVPLWAQNQKSPPWADPPLAEKIKIQSDLIEYVKKVVERYKNNPSLIMWQVENEPFLWFGKCPEISKDFLDEEIALVKSVDPGRPVLITDGGEFGLWYKAAAKSDVFGTTMYRKVFPRFIGPIFGVIEYPILPSFFRLKEKIIRNLSAVGQKKFIVSELQAEPWGPELLPYLSYEEQKKIFNPEYFSETINFAKETGFDEYYLWGAEWWFWLKEKKGDPAIWNEVRELIEER